MLFPPTTGPKPVEPVKYDFNRLGFEGHDVAEFLSQTLSIDFPYTAPFPWAAVGAGMSGMFVLASLIFYIVPKLANSQRSVAAMSAAGLKTMLMLGSLAIIVVMCSGHMWNSIRQAPYMSVGQGGRPEYFASGFQNQYGAETHIVGAMCEYIPLLLLLPHTLTRPHIHRCSAGLLLCEPGRLCTGAARPCPPARRRVRMERHLPRYVQPRLFRVQIKEVSAECARCLVRVRPLTFACSHSPSYPFRLFF